MIRDLRRLLIALRIAQRDREQREAEAVANYLEALGQGRG